MGRNTKSRQNTGKDRIIAGLMGADVTHGNFLAYRYGTPDIRLFVEHEAGMAHKRVIANIELARGIVLDTLLYRADIDGKKAFFGEVWVEDWIVADEK